MSFISQMPARKPQDLKKQLGISKTSKKWYKQKWFVVTALIVGILMIGGGVMAYKTGYVLNKISDSDSSIIKSLFNVLPVVGSDELKEEDDGRINVALLGMRGQNIPGGGLLADSIMVISLNTKDNKVAMISIPRDLYVKYPGTESRTKVNAVHAFGEERGKGNGLKAMKEILGEVTGLQIHYAVSINFTGFKQLIDAVGGVDLMLETPFYETHQFVEGKECGIEFSLSAGKNTLDGEKALCYARARDNTSDFDRSKRQQVILKALKDKLVSMGTLTDFSKMNGILNAIGENVRTDMASYEMKNFYEKYVSMKDAQIYQRVFENSEEGFLTVPQESNGAGYILIPRAGQDNYSQMQDVCRNIFTLPAQSDIDPMKQRTKPASTEVNTQEVKKKDKKKQSSDEADATVKGTSDSKTTSNDSKSSSKKTDSKSETDNKD